MEAKKYNMAEHIDNLKDIGCIIINKEYVIQYDGERNWCLHKNPRVILDKNGKKQLTSSDVQYHRTLAALFRTTKEKLISGKLVPQEDKSLDMRNITKEELRAMFTDFENSLFETITALTAELDNKFSKGGA